MLIGVGEKHPKSWKRRNQENNPKSSGTAQIAGSMRYMKILCSIFEKINVLSCGFIGH